MRAKSAVVFLAAVFWVLNTQAQSSLNWVVSPKSGCRPLKVTFTNISLGVDSIYWNMGDGNIFYTNGSIPDTIWTYSSAGTYYASFWELDSLGNFTFANDTATITVTGGSGSFSQSDDTICPGENVFFSTAANSSYYMWNFGDGYTATGQFVNHTFTSLGTYTVSLYINGPVCGKDTITAPVAVVNNKRPVLGAFSVSDTIVCRGQTVAYQLNSYAEYDTVYWFFGDGFASAVYDTYNYHFYSSLGTKTVKLVVFNNCGLSDTGIRTINVVNTLPAEPVSFSISDHLACTNKPITFTLNNWTDYTGISWHFGDGDSSSSLGLVTTHSYAASGTYYVRIIGRNGCLKTAAGYDTIVVDGNMKPVIGPYTIIPYVTCKEDPISFWLQDWYKFSSLTWYYGDGDSGIWLNEYNYHAYADTGVYDTRIVVRNDCGNIDTGSKRVYVVTQLYPPSITNYSTSKTVACPGEEIVFYVGQYYYYHHIIWDFGDGSQGTLTAYENFHEYDDTGTYLVTLMVFNGCGYGDTVTMNITIVDTIPLTLGPWFVQDPLECPGAQVKYLLPDHDDYEDFTWYFGDGDSGTDYSSINTHAYSSNGLYTVTLVAFNGCGKSDTGSTVVTVVDTIHPKIGTHFVFDTIICPDDVVNFYLLNPKNYAYVNWNYGDGNADTMRSVYNFHAYADTGDYLVELVVTNECALTDTSRKWVHVVDSLSPKPRIYSVYDTVVCPGDRVVYYLGNYNVFNNFTWYYGDGGSGTDYAVNNFHSYADTGDYKVRLAVANGCGEADTSYAWVHVINTMQATAVFNPSSSLLCKQIDTFYFSPVNPFYDQYLWDFGDGDTSHSYLGKHAYQNAGTYTVTLIATNGCNNSDTFSRVVSTYPETQADFADVCVCGTNTVLFTDKSAGTTTSWDWDFGDGNTSTLPNPDHAYAAPGTYNVCLTITDNCGFTDQSCRSVQVNCYKPTAKFGYTVNGMDVTLTDSSINASSWEWDMGDSGIFTLQNFTHTYGQAGTFIICLTARNYCGSSDRVCKPVLISGIGTERKQEPLLIAYPNPYKGTTQVYFSLPRKEEINLSVYNILGRRIAVLREGKLGQGDYQVSFSAATLGYPPGIYLLRLQVGGSMAAKVIIEID